MRMASMRPTTIRKTALMDFLKSEKRLELPPRVRSNPTNFPLWCALMSIPRHIKDKGEEMDAIHNGMARYPFRNWNSAGYTLEERVAKHKSLTWLQRHFLLCWIASRYRGAYRDGYADSFHVDGIRTKEQKHAASEVRRYVFDALQKCGMTEASLPLRTILSDEFGCLIRILFIDFYLRGKK